MNRLNRFPVELDDQLDAHLRHLEHANEPVLAIASDYPDGYFVPPHSHTRSQLLYARTGVALVATDFGRWLVPADHAVWLPAGIEHAVEMMGDVRMHSVYLLPGLSQGHPDRLKVMSMTDLMRSLIEETILREGRADGRREALVEALMIEEIAMLPERPLVLPLPREQRLAALCRRFVASPSPHATIDRWAKAAGMSRRTFTRMFLRETGLSLSAWRQQALVLAALPRLAEGQAVTQIALDLGYDSVPAFTTMFRRLLGVSPRSFANRASGT